VTLTISAGVRVDGTAFYTYGGNITVLGTSASRTVLDRVQIENKSFSAPYPQINIQYSTITDVFLGFLEGRFGASTFSNNYFLNLEGSNYSRITAYGDITYTSNVFINKLFHIRNYQGNVSFTSNLFYGNGALYQADRENGKSTSLSNNYFATPVGLLNLAYGASNAEISAGGNYWEGASGNIETVKSWITDREDSLSWPGFITVSPLLSSIPASVPVFDVGATAATGNPSVVGALTATITGQINPRFMTVESSTEYGTDSQLSSGTLTGPLNTHIDSWPRSRFNGSTPMETVGDLSNLSPATRYYYRVVASTSVGIIRGEIKSFTTLGSVPTVSNEQSSNLSVSGASITASVGAGLLPTSASVVYGTNSTLSSGTSTVAMGSAVGDSATSLTANLTGLSPQTTYYYRVVATNSLGTTSGTIRSFTTIADSASAFLVRTETLNGSATTGPVLTGSSIYLDARTSTTASGVFSKFEWDLDGDGTFEIDGGLNGLYTTSFMNDGVKSVAVRVTGLGGLTNTKSLTIDVRKSPPAGETGVSMLDGAAFTNTKSVKINLVWPSFATEARISNDGGFAASKTRTVSLANLVEWELDDSVKGIFTKVVYVRFNGSGIDTNRTYSDDIILDTTAPVLESSSAVPGSGKIDLTLKASDDITGVDKVEIKNGTTSVTKDYNSKISVSEKEIGLTVSSASIRKLSASSIQIRVRDRAGNWSGYQTLSLARATAAPSSTAVVPKLTMKKSASSRSIAVFANIKAPSTSKVTLKVVGSSTKFCKVSGATLRGLKTGSCRVTVTVTPKKGRATSKTVTLKVTK
jgi:hypothetical protein